MKSDFKSMLSVSLNSEAILLKEFFLHCHPVNQQFCIGVLRVFMEAVGRKCSSSSRHGTGFCIMTTHHATQIYGFFRYLNKKRMVVVSGLCISQSYTSWFILILKDSNMVKGMKIQGYLKHCSASQNRSFRSVSSCGRHWVQCVSAEQQ